MDYTLNEQQEMFRTAARDFLRNECPLTLVREIEDKKLDYSPSLYRKMADLGWFQLMIPPEYKGIGSSWINLAIFCEEAGRALLPGPYYATTLSGQVILALADDARKRELLPGIAAGEVILTLALAEPQAVSDLSLLNTSAASSGNDYIINGTKLFIPYAHIADHIIVVARQKEGGLALFLVPKGTKGLTCTPLDTLSGERLCEVVFDNVKVPQKQLLGKCREQDLMDITERMKIMVCAEMLGATQAALDMTVGYSKQRISWDRPIGSLQSLQHKMVEMAVEVDGLRWLVYQTAWMLDEGIPCSRQLAVAQLEAKQVCNWVLTQATHVTGTISLTRDHDLTLYYRRVKAAGLSLGSSDALEETIARTLGI